MFNGLFNNARILLIGGGDIDLARLENTRQDWIWFRVNGHFARQGGRVDVGFTNSHPLAIDRFHSAMRSRRIAPKIFIARDTARSAPLVRFARSISCETILYETDCDRVKELRRRYFSGGEPFTGILALYFLLTDPAPPSEVRLEGFDFYRANRGGRPLAGHNLFENAATLLSFVSAFKPVRAPRSTIIECAEIIRNHKRPNIIDSY